MSSALPERVSVLYAPIGDEDLNLGGLTVMPCASAGLGPCVATDCCPALSHCPTTTPFTPPRFGCLPSMAQPEEEWISILEPAIWFGCHALAKTRTSPWTGVNSSLPTTRTAKAATAKDARAGIHRVRILMAQAGRYTP